MSVALNRYKNSSVIQGQMSDVSVRKYATSSLTSRIYQACESGQVSSRITTFKKGDRLDLISQNEYGNGFDWWIIAAASGIGWWLQINEDTIVRIPDRDQIRRLFNL